MPRLERLLLITPKPSEYIGGHSITSDLTDNYGHVNNAKYLEIFEAQRSLYVAAAGFPLQELESKFCLLAFISDMQVKYYKEIFPDDEVAVHTVAQATRRNIVFNQEMYNKGILASSLDCIVWVVNSEHRRAVPVPQEIVRMVNQAKFL